MAFTIHATRDPEMIRRAAEIQYGDRISLYRHDPETLGHIRQRISKVADETDWATSSAISGWQPLIAKGRAHQVVATGDWGFLEQQYRQLEAQLTAAKGVRGARKSADIHLAAPDGRWFTINVPSGEVGSAEAGAKKAHPVWENVLRFVWTPDGRLVLTGDTGSSLKRPRGHSFCAQSHEGFDAKRRPSRVCWDWIEALCEAACSMTPQSVAEFGKTTGICAICGKSLTDRLSKERGIGPVCWDRVMTTSLSAEVA
jgi:hypothetical protein